MKIAFLGTKGVPNNYGGFEQFAEEISKRLVKKGHQVTVYNPSHHPYKESSFEGVEICRVFSPEKLLGGAANIIYDHFCLKDALSKDFDIIYEAGYHSVALSYKWFRVRRRTRPIIVTNMDGLEWKRSKWSSSVQNLIKKLERIAVAQSPYLISDNQGIQNYLKTTYNAASFYVPYGADPIEKFEPSHLLDYRVKEGAYFILVARLEPENNVEIIIKGHIRSATQTPLLIVGKHATPYGRYLKTNYESERVCFIGGIYDKTKLDSIRHFSLAYFHGHSVGGTNPSLLEAMASQCFIISHKNPFNESVLDRSAVYFEDEDGVAEIITDIQVLPPDRRERFVGENFQKIKTLYTWDAIVNQHEDLFQSLIKKI